MADKKYKNLVYLFIGASGNAATWLEPLAISGGTYAYGGYPDIDGLFREQAVELDRAKREATLHKIQQLIHERAMFAPVWDFAFLHGVGPRVEESGLGLLGSYGFSALDTPLESGQRVEIVAAKSGGPSRDWLIAERGFVKSPRARAKIRQWFNAQELAQTIEDVAGWMTEVATFPVGADEPPAFYLEADP